MGFGTVIATIFSVTLLVVATFVIMSILFDSTDMISTSFKELKENSNEQLKTEISVSTVIASASNVNVSINNTGHVKITDFQNMDVLIRYYSYSESETSNIKWIPYTEGLPPASNTWTDNGISPDVINPGILDPDEAMNMWIKVDPPVWNQSENNWLQITTPNGVSASSYFNGNGA